MTWNLYSEKDFLEPLRFSNGKNQKDIVNEVLEAIKKGNKIIFIKGVCGTGKSAIALNIARNLGKASVIVPGKTLQNQYKEDYENKKYLLKKNGERMKISVIMGRNNFKCKFLEDNEIILPKEKKEINANLHDIFEFSKEQLEDKRKKDVSADRWDIPCKIEIKEKNSKKINEYLKQNKKINYRNIFDIKNVKRASIAPVCPYWSPVISEEYELKNFDDAEQRKYMGLNKTKFIFYQRKKGCKFYEQFNSFIDGDVIIFNSLKYKLESSMNRKPATEVEIIDECDEFLDSFSNQSTINISRLQNALNYAFPEEESNQKILEELNELIKKIKKDRRIEEAVYGKSILSLKETKIYDLLKIFMNNPDFVFDLDEESYLHDVEETARMFDEFSDETYLTFYKNDGNLNVELVVTNLAKKFKEMVDKNKLIVLMSGTIHSDDVLKNIFGLDNYVVIDAEVQQQGNIDVIKTGLEMDCKYENFSNGKNTREKYLKALSKCIEIAKKPALVHINSFHDLPSEKEIEEMEIDSLMSREKLKELQKNDKQGEAATEFKKGKIEVLFSTKVSRGMDFPGEKCNSIIFTKYPNPDVQSAFWKILKKTKPNYYWAFYKDKARRELWQRIYRGLRFKEDHIFLLSPDIRVLNAFEK
ncbi:MAG: helicase C-terminal domain-containing protein [archaeon]